MASIYKLYLIPDVPATDAAYQTLTPGEIVSSTITDAYSSGIVKLNCQSNGNVQFDVKISHLTTAIWDTIYYTTSGNNRWFQRYIDLRDQKFQAVITSLETIDDCDVKAYLDVFDGLAYGTVQQFRDTTNIAEETVSDHLVAQALLNTYDKVNAHTKKSRTDPWLSTDEFYEKIQVAQTMLTAHFCAIKGWDAIPTDNTKITEMSSQWLYQYCLEIFDIMGYYPYELSGLPEVTNKHRTAFDGAAMLVTMQDSTSNQYGQTSKRQGGSATQNKPPEL